jgi:hypothetical protein
MKQKQSRLKRSDAAIVCMIALLLLAAIAPAVSGCKGVLHRANLNDCNPRSVDSIGSRCEDAADDSDRHL